MRKKVLIIGGGYGGTEVIRQMLLRGVRNVEVELVSKKAHFENTIGCAEIISEKTKPQELTYDLKQLSAYWGFELTVRAAGKIDLKEKTVAVGSKTKDYDLLVVATGSEPNLYNVKGAELAHAAYHLPDFIDLNEKLRQLPDTPNIVVVGAGFVGLECAAEILDLYKAMSRKVGMMVVERMDSILPAYSNASARRITYEHFSSRGVIFKLGNGVKGVEERRLILEDGSPVEADLAIWAAGVKACIAPPQVRAESLYKGCIDVDSRLLIKGREDAFAIGDVAYVRTNGREAAKMAAEALEQARTVAKNIGMIAGGKKPRVSYAVNYATDYPVALMSMGEGKAMLLLGPEYVSKGATEYLLKKRIDFQEMMERFPR